MPDIFHTLAQIAVAITGFSSLIVVFGGGSAAWTGHNYVTFAFSLSWSIGSIFLSVFPLLLGEFEVPIAVAARVGLFAAAAYMMTMGCILTFLRARLARSGIGGVRRNMSIVMSVVFLTIVGIALAAGIGVLPGPMHAWYAATIVFLMAHATAELGILVVQSMRRTSDRH